MNVFSTVKLPVHMKEDLLNGFPEAKFSFDNKIEEAGDELRNAEVILTYGEDLTAEIIAEASSLKWIMVASAGMDRMPFEALRDKKILVTNAKGVHKIPMAEYTLSMMLQISRDAAKLSENQQKRKWDRRVVMNEIHGKTLFVLGAGAIGTEIARLAKAFGMTAVGMNRSGKSVEFFDENLTFEEMNRGLQEADFVVSVLPSTGETRHILNLDAFRQMKKEAVFINIGRGDAVVEADLITALNEGSLKHAVLDVFEEEPLKEDHPFWEMEKVTVTPHLSGITKNYLPRAMEIFKRNLRRYLDGDPSAFENPVDLEKEY
ncbi:D-2-hydroxyacid dehydrogenase [Metabacillus indicus]|uniref:D-2-hydroxyacid dehydrogenase n=1 Tax=Metabacillus indicus TaxID=246786 RepID=UPI002490264B|nr:D-2-hydroxyacid dehydrogenase [Metabacillus indicus]